MRTQAKPDIQKKSKNIFPLQRPPPNLSFTFQLKFQTCIFFLKHVTLRKKLLRMIYIEKNSASPYPWYTILYCLSTSFHFPFAWLHWNKPLAFIGLFSELKSRHLKPRDVVTEMRCFFSILDWRSPDSKIITAPVALHPCFSSL